MPGYDLITILGPTASGKTSFAIALTHELDVETISVDPRQIYRRMDLSTGGDLTDYTVDGHPIPYRLVDTTDPGCKHNALEYQWDFLISYEPIRQRGCLPALCGGTGMYLESVLKGHKLMPVSEDPESHTRLANHSFGELTEILKQYKTLRNSTDVDIVKRAIRAIEIEGYYAVRPVPEREFPKLSSLVIGVDIDWGLRCEKITRRLKQRSDEGMADKVRRLTEQGTSLDGLTYYGLEYKSLTLYAIGELTYGETFTELETAIHQSAKRQMTWSHSMERWGFTIHWVNVELPIEEKIVFVMEKL